MHIIELIASAFGSNHTFVSVMEKIIFGIVLLHLLAGFGWVIYKLEKKGK
jgi:hypothetical protein